MRTITTFANDYGRWSFDSGTTTRLDLGGGEVATTLPEFFRLMHRQRDTHRLAGIAYTITQEIIPQGGEPQHDAVHPDRPADAGPQQREGVER
jgi:hypothetical protein